MRWILRPHQDFDGEWAVGGPPPSAQSVPVEVIPASYTEEDVERVAIAIASADDHGYDTDEEGFRHYSTYYLAAARAALDAFLKQ